MGCQTVRSVGDKHDCAQGTSRSESTHTLYQARTTVPSSHTRVARGWAQTKNPKDLMRTGRQRRWGMEGTLPPCS